jgi:hypothetical protein
MTGLSPSASCTPFGQGFQSRAARDEGDVVPSLVQARSVKTPEHARTVYKDFHCCSIID